MKQLIKTTEPILDEAFEAKSTESPAMSDVTAHT